MSPTKIPSIKVISCVLNLYELPLPDRAAGSPQSPPIYILPKVDTACDDAFYNGKHPPLKMRKRILMILRQKSRKMMRRMMDMWMKLKIRMQDMPN